MDPTEFESHLEALLEEAEETARGLRAELRRVRANAEFDQRAAQHAEVDRLGEHLAQTQVDWAKVRAFFEEAVRELRETQNGGD